MLRDHFARKKTALIVASASHDRQRPPDNLSDYRCPKRPDRDTGRSLPDRQELRANTARLKQVAILPIKPNTGLG
jgi:hypothetical protein